MSTVCDRLERRAAWLEGSASHPVHRIVAGPRLRLRDARQELLVQAGELAPLRRPDDDVGDAVLGNERRRLRAARIDLDHVRRPLLERDAVLAEPVVEAEDGRAAGQEGYRG